MTAVLTVSPDVDMDESELPASPLAPALAQRLGPLYEERVGGYLGDLARVLGIDASLGTSGADVPASRMPSLPFKPPPVDDDTTEEAELLTFDEELFVSLLDVYVCYGWSPLVAIEADIKAMLEEDTKRRPTSGPGSESVWPVVLSFFEYCRNMLSLLVRDELVAIERLMARRLFENLNQTADGIATTWSRLRVKQTSETVESPSDPDLGRAVHTVTFEEQVLAEQMFLGVKDAAKHRFAYENTLKKLKSATEAMRAMRELIAEPRWRRFRFPPAWEQQRLRECELQVIEQMEAERAARDLQMALRANVFYNYPAALLVFDSLKPGFTQPDFEKLLGETLWQFYKRVDELAQHIDENKSLTAAELPALAEGEDLLWTAVQRHAAPAGGPSRLMVSVAIEELPGDPACFALLHEATLQELIGSEAIDRDSLTFVVAHHHLMEVIDAIERRRVEEEGWREFWSRFARMSAAASIAALFTPGGQPVAPILRGSAVISDLVLLTHSVSGAMEQLRMIDKVLDDGLVSSGGFSMASLGRLGELRAYSQSLLDNLALGVLIQLGLTFAGAGWVKVKKLLLAKGFHTDLETLYGTEQEAG